jgi:hypothetical protein
MKAAGVPKATIATLRVEHGGHLSLRSAISIAHERGLDTGKAHEFMAKRDAKKAAAPAAQAATADFRSKAAATMKAAGERTAKEGRAAVLAARLRDRAANAFGTKRGDIANARADRILKANPGARGLSEQLRGERRFETKSAVNQTMRLGQVSRSNFNLPATRSERVAGLLSSMRAKEAQSAARRADMKKAQQGAALTDAKKRRSATDFYAPPSRGPSKREKQAIRDARDVILGPRAGAKKPAGEPQRWKNAVDERPQSVDVGYSSRRSVANAGGFHAVAYPQPGGRVNFDVVHPRTGARIASVATADDAKKILRAVASGRLEKQLKDGALPSPRTRVALQRVVDAVQRSALKRAIEIGKQKRQWTGRQERELSALEANRISGRKR